jgi:hypothetical protein
MRRKDLLSRSEERALGLLERALLGRGYRVYVQIPLRKIIDREEANLPRDEWNMLQHGEVDFLVVNRDEGMGIEFAVEFDGHPYHRSEHVQVRDRIKDLLCARVGIPLVRIPDEAIGEREQITVLEWIVDCFHVFRSEPHRIHEAVEVLRDYNATFERRGVIDPAIALHTINPFPATGEIQARLRKRFGIESQRTGLPEPYDPAVPWEEHDTTRWLRALLKLKDLNHIDYGSEDDEEESDEKSEDTGPPNTFRLGLARQTPENIEWLHVAETPIRWSPEHLAAQALVAYRVGSWMWAVDVALSEYLAHAEIERWADRHLARIDRG